MEPAQLVALVVVVSVDLVIGVVWFFSSRNGVTAGADGRENRGGRPPARGAVRVRSGRRAHRHVAAPAPSGGGGVCRYRTSGVTIGSSGPRDRARSTRHDARATRLGADSADRERDVSLRETESSRGPELAASIALTALAHVSRRDATPAG